MHTSLLQTTREFVDLYQCVQSHSPTNASHLNSHHNTHVFQDYQTYLKSHEGVKSEARGGVGGDDLPESMDWRRSGIVTKVKDQVSTCSHMHVHVHVQQGQGYKQSVVLGQYFRKILLINIINKRFDRSQIISTHQNTQKYLIHNNYCIVTEHLLICYFCQHLFC